LLLMSFSSSSLRRLEYVEQLLQLLQQWNGRRNERAVSLLARFHRYHPEEFEFARNRLQLRLAITNHEVLFRWIKL
jgi:hypothetical protein